MVTGVHHINFLVRDLDAARERFSSLGLKFESPVTLPARGVVTSRARLGNVWLVLVQPQSMDSLPGRRLAAQGEGIFLVSFEVDDLDSAVAAIGENGGRVSGDPRHGLDDWQVIDLDPTAFCGAALQLCVETSRTVAGASGV
ncbi:MAG: VOC family protein [Steroidobacteraceae bacterium]